MSDARIRFIQQQGFEGASALTCDLQYPALMFQPRVIGGLVLAAVLLQSSSLFLALSAALWLSALTPKLNPFELVYNTVVAARKRRPPLSVAPAPRRFAQGLAATLMLLIGLSLLAGWNTLAWAIEAILVAALVALIAGGFCVGSYVFHLLVGNRRLAKRTLP
jgi:hypothetical protein